MRDSAVLDIERQFPTVTSRKSDRQRAFKKCNLLIKYDYHEEQMWEIQKVIQFFPEVFLTFSLKYFCQNTKLLIFLKIIF